MASDVLKELGKRIRQRRKALGWSQERFALEAEIDRSYVGGVERGQRNVTFTVLCRLCVALECDVAELGVNLPRTAHP